MREIRTYGSVRGVARKGHPYRDKTKASCRLYFCPRFFLPHWSKLELTIIMYFCIIANESGLFFGNLL
jgi:hypothetical protein